jgi:hypothetical protein
MQETLWEAEFAAKNKAAKAAVSTPAQFKTPALSSSAKSNKPVPYWVQDESSVQNYKPLKFGGELEVAFKPIVSSQRTLLSTFLNLEAEFDLTA